MQGLGMLIAIRITSVFVLPTAVDTVELQSSGDARFCIRQRSRLDGSTDRVRVYCQRNDRG